MFDPHFSFRGEHRFVTLDGTGRLIGCLRKDRVAIEGEFLCADLTLGLPERSDPDCVRSCTRPYGLTATSL